MMIEREPANVALRNDLALLCLELGRPRDAVTHFEAARALAPSAAAHFNVGVALMAADEANRALESFERALQLNPAYVPARLNAGNALLTLGNPTAAREQFREVLRQQPANAVALNSLGLALLRLGKKTEALARFEESIRRDPSYGDPHFNIGRSLSDHVGASSAEAHLRLAIALNPESAAALGELAWLLAAGAPESERRPPEAVRLADAAVALSHRRDATLLGVLAVSYEQAGRADDARHTAIESLAVLAGSPVSLSEPLRSRLDRIVQ
jgi:tetratricopeptide (TPR) repeat protein